jgi:aspartyl-tRNA(Asn)/glutamyl-tRNA(Gln) amidotransferase subunit B
VTATLPPRQTSADHLQSLVNHLTANLPMLPDALVAELVQEHGLTTKDAKTLVALDGGDRLDYYYEACDSLATLKGGSSPVSLAERRTVSNW